MFDNYKDIFNARGAAYHQAMLENPRARAQEFDAILRLARPQMGQTICDMPSGGGYLRHFLPPELDVRLICVETSQAFADHVPTTDRVRPVLAELHDVPLESGSVDTIVSMAGLHHVTDKPAVLREMRRLLKPAGGRACLADVGAGSRIDRFLNGFVHRNNTMGHQGEFFDDRVRQDLRNAGFHILSDAVQRYYWTYASEQAMARFCRLLFGLDRIDERATIDGIREHLGCEQAPDGRWRMNWELTFLEATPA